MSQGTFVVFGFFALADGHRRTVQKPISPSKKLHSAPPSTQSSTWYNFYTTTLQYSDDTSAPSAEIRIYSPPGDSPHPDNTIAFIVAKAHIPHTGPVLLDATCMYPIPGNLLSADYEDHAPNMLYPYVYGIGTTIAKAETRSRWEVQGLYCQSYRACLGRASDLLGFVRFPPFMSMYVFMLTPLRLC